MKREQKTLLLPCGACATEIEIVSGQAGGHAECPSCHRQNDVPKFRDLEQLQIKASSAVKPTMPWGLPQALAMAGVSVAVLTCATVALVGSPPKSAFDRERLRASIFAVDDTRLYLALEDFSRASVARPPTIEETELNRRTQYSRGVSRALFAIGGLGAAVAAAAGLVILSGSKTKPIVDSIRG
ncbi:MAG: hypothetical protein WCQ77_00175 [Planctomycetota bacterium]